MAKPTEKVSIQKQELPSVRGGDPADQTADPVPINPVEDVVQVAGVEFCAPGKIDDKVSIWRDGDQLFLEDATAGLRTLSQILEYLPSHSHSVSDVTSLQDVLNGKANTVHTHTFASLTSKPTTLLGYGITDASPSTHDHNALYLRLTGGEISGQVILNSELMVEDVVVNNSFLAGSSFNLPGYPTPPSGHTQSSIYWNTTSKKLFVHNGTSFQEIGGGGGVSVHNDLTGRSTADAHPISAITGLQAALNDKSDTGHTHADATWSSSGFMSSQHQVAVNNHIILGDDFNNDGGYRHTSVAANDYEANYGSRSPDDWAFEEGNYGSNSTMFSKATEQTHDGLVPPNGFSATVVTVSGGENMNYGVHGLHQLGFQSTPDDTFDPANGRPMYRFGLGYTSEPWTPWKKILIEGDAPDAQDIYDEFNNVYFAISGKANATHTHTIENITGLQATLNAKAEHALVASISSYVTPAADKVYSMGESVTALYRWGGYGYDLVIETGSIQGYLSTAHPLGDGYVHLEFGTEFPQDYMVHVTAGGTSVNYGGMCTASVIGRDQYYTLLRFFDLENYLGDDVGEFTVTITVTDPF